MNLRLEHSHFFNDKAKQAGHYHTDTTPEIIEYLAYLVTILHVPFPELPAYSFRRNVRHL